MLRNKKVLAGIVVLALIAAGGGFGYSKWNNDSGSSKQETIILKKVTRQTLKDTVTVNGTLAREELRNVTSVSQGRVSAVYAKDGSTGEAGERLFALDGRDAIAEPGSVQFFRPLGVGDIGDDVVQLKQILAAAGDNPGPMSDLFTNQTQAALGQWQAQHHYPDATPVAPQSVTVSLAQGAGYTLGNQSAAGLIIGADAQTTAASAGGVRHAELTAFRSVDATPAVTPVLTIQSAAAQVSEGTPATFVISASAASATDLSINIGTSGTATSDDIVTPPSVVTLPANATSVQVSVATRVDTVVKPKKALTITLEGGTGYSIGSPGSARTTIANNNVPALSIGGGTTVSPGGSTTLTVTADQAPIHDMQISLQFAGDATAGTDYQPVNPVLVMRAGQRSASVTVTTLRNREIAPTRHVVVSISPSPTTYGVRSPGIAVIAIAGTSGDAALPIVTLRSSTTYLSKGGSAGGLGAGAGGGGAYPVTLSLNQAINRPLTVVLAYGGNAALGTDFTLPGGSIVVPAGQTSLTVQVPIVTSNIVESNRVLIVALAQSADYRIGSPNRAKVTIASGVVPELTITADSNTVAPGGAATFTITADQAPVKNTSINLQALGTAQPGVDYQPLVGTVLLAAGQKSVTVTLRSIQKNVAFLPTDMIVGNWPIRIGQVFVKEGDPVPPGQAVLSLTDPNFTVTLQASASDRTKLKVGQHCTVQLVGGFNQEAGTISELDSTQTSLTATSPGATPQQVYEGKIEVGDLGAADGAAVTIEVTDQQETNVMTVPIAAVKQNGSGQDVVRVIDVDNGGKVTEVPVKTGLSEGSYIEIKSGLKGNETVIVQVDKQS